MWINHKIVVNIEWTTHLFHHFSNLNGATKNWRSSAIFISDMINDDAEEYLNNDLFHQFSSQFE